MCSEAQPSASFDLGSRAASRHQAPAAAAAAGSIGAGGIGAGGIGAGGIGAGGAGGAGGSIGAGARSWHIMGFSARRVASRGWLGFARYDTRLTKSIGRHPYFMLCCFTHRDRLLIIMHGKKSDRAPLPRPLREQGTALLQLVTTDSTDLCRVTSNLTALRL